MTAAHLLQDYVFSILTGYCDAPAGIQLREGQNYNPYFPGQAIAMAQPLFDDMITYADGSALLAYVSNSRFLRHTGNDEPDGQGRRHVPDVVQRARARRPQAHGNEGTRGAVRRRAGHVVRQMRLFFDLAHALHCRYLKRHKWSTLMSRKVLYKPPSK